MQKLEGVYPASLSMERIEPDASLTATRWTLVFPDAAPELFEPGRTYVVDLLPVSRMAGLIASMRRRRRWSQARLAQEAKGVGQSAISEAERGVARLSPPHASQLYRTLPGGILCLAAVEDEPGTPDGAEASIIPLDETTPYAVTVGGLLRTLRVRKGYTQSAVANRLGWKSQGAISDIESGRTRHALPDRLEQAFSALGTRLVYCGIRIGE